MPGVPPLGSSAPSPWRRLAPILLVAIVSLSYFNAINNPFVFDDNMVILENPAIRSLWPIGNVLFPPGSSFTAGRPMTGLSLAINYAIDGTNPRGYHLGNLVLHAMAALTLLGVLRLTLRRLDHPQADGAALAAAAIWAAHPMLTESVTYATNRSEVLMGLFFLLTFYTFLRSLDSPKSRRWLTLSVASALAACAAKEVATMLTPLVLIFDVLIVTGSWKQSLKQRRWFYVGLACTAMLLPATLLTSSAQTKNVLHSQTISSWQYLLMQSRVITRYLQLAVWPNPLVITYTDWPVPRSILQVWPWMVFIGGLVVATFIGVARRRAWAVLGAWFFMILAPTSSILPIVIEPAGERRMYLPLIAAAVGAVLLFARWLRKIPRGEAVGLGAASVVVLLLMLATVWRNEDYSSVLMIWSDAINKRPNNAVAHYSKGAELVRLGNPIDALPEFDEAIRLDPNDLDAPVARGLALSRLGRHDEAIAAIRAALQRDPKNPYILAALADVQDRKKSAGAAH